MRPWEILHQRLTSARRWPLPNEAKIHLWIRIWTAIRENDEPVLRILMDWPTDRPLIIDNLGEKIASAYGDLLFGRDPVVTPADETDGDRATELTAAYGTDLPAAEETCASEGEVWWRLTTDPNMPHPILTWHSRHDVVPLLRGREPLAIAFIDVLPNASAEHGVVWRHVEIHDAGTVVNTLWRGREDVLGQELELVRHQDTAALQPIWETQVPGLLAGRVVNRWGRKPHHGVSVYQGVWSRLLALNEATTIGRENARLTAKKRLTGPASALTSVNPLQRPDLNVDSIDRGDGTRTPVTSPRVRFDAGEDYIANDPLDVDEGSSAVNAIKILEYNFDADQLVAWLKFEIETICQRCDIVPQFIGSGDFGAGNTGTALRVRLIPTVNAAESRGRAWDGTLPTIVQRAQLLEAQPRTNGGLGITWTSPGGLPEVKRSSALPEDPIEQAQRLSTLKTSSLISIETAVTELYPDRDGKFVTAEVERIRADEAASMPAASPFGPPSPAPPAPVPAPPPGG